MAQIHTVASRRFDIFASCPRGLYRHFEALQNELRGNVEQEEIANCYDISTPRLRPLSFLRSGVGPFTELLGVKVHS